MQRKQLSTRKGVLQKMCTLLLFYQGPIETPHESFLAWGLEHWSHQERVSEVSSMFCVSSWLLLTSQRQSHLTALIIHEKQIPLPKATIVQTWLCLRLLFGSPCQRLLLGSPICSPPGPLPQIPGHQTLRKTFKKGKESVSTGEASTSLSKAQASLQ